MVPLSSRLLLSLTDSSALMNKVTKASLSWRHNCSVQEETEGTLKKCQCNAVILDSLCQAISLIMVLIWNVGSWSISAPPPSSPLPFKFSTPSNLLLLFLPLPFFFHTQWYQNQHQNHSGKLKRSCSPPVYFLKALAETTVEFSLTLCSICISLQWRGPEMSVCTQGTEVEGYMACLFTKQWNLEYIFKIISHNNISVLLHSTLLYAIVIRELFKCCFCSSWMFSNNDMVVVADSTSPLVSSLANIKCY